MSTATFIILGELNDFLSPERRGLQFQYEFDGTPSVKHLVEALHIPHTEIGEIYINNKIVQFSCLVRDGDHVLIVPNKPGVINSFCSQDEGISDTFPRFLLDNHLGKLATYLRMMGFDSKYNNSFQDEELARIAVEEKRILLTRDRGLLMRRVIEHGYCIRALDPKQQVVEVVRRFDLINLIRPFRRCLRCNGELIPVTKGEIVQQLLPLTKRYYHEFCICKECKNVYWKGSHFSRMNRFIDAVKKSAKM